MNAYEVRDVPTKDIDTLYGTFHYDRTALRPMNKKDRLRYEELTGGGGSLYPMDSELKVNTLPFRVSCRALSHVVETSIRAGSYNEGQNIISKRSGKDGALIYAGKYTEFAGRLVFERDRARAVGAVEALKRGDKRSAGECDDGGRLYIALGRSPVHYRDGDKTASGLKPVLYCVTFREKDIEYLYDSAGRVASFEITKKDVSAFIGSGEDFKPFVADCALRGGFLSCTDTVVISDGSDYAEGIAAELFPDALFFIKAEAVRGMAVEWLFRLKLSQKMREDYRRRIDSFICEGDTEGLLGAIAPHRFDDIPDDEDDELCPVPGGFKRFYDFIRRKGEMMRYKDYREAGIFVGTGASEVSEDAVFSGGLKIKSVNLKPEELQSVVSVHALYHSGRFDELVPLLESAPPIKESRRQSREK